MLKAEGYKAQVFQYTETNNVVHIETPNGDIVKVLIPIDLVKHGITILSKPFGLNLLTFGHYE